MTPDERLTRAVENLKSEDQDQVFEALRQIADEFGWELSKRDPGPVYCELDAAWCRTHNEWIDEHNWAMSPEDLAEAEAKVQHPSTPLGWFKAAGIVPEDAEMGTAQIKDTYRHLALVRRK